MGARVGEAIRWAFEALRANLRLWLGLGIVYAAAVLAWFVPGFVVLIPVVELLIILLAPVVVTSALQLVQERRLSLPGLRSYISILAMGLLAGVVAMAVIAPVVVLAYELLYSGDFLRDSFIAALAGAVALALIAPLLIYQLFVTADGTRGFAQSFVLGLKIGIRSYAPTFAILVLAVLGTVAGWLVLLVDISSPILILLLSVPAFAYWSAVFALTSLAFAHVYRQATSAPAPKNKRRSL